ncbi:MAG: ParB/RepB/Spo0J family partition protein [Pseudomonadota bacterium]
MATRPDETPISEVIDVSKLEFDKENPRFPVDINALDEDALIERFVRDERLQEIVESIGDHGYFPGEPLLVVPKRGKYIVVEGNRRLAALKLLNGLANPPEGRIAIERAIERAKHRPKKVQCLVFTSQKYTLRYLGFRHITGIKPWNALQKARYMQKLLDDVPNNLRPDAGLKLLARETGSSSTYLGQSLAALRIYEAAESENFFKLKLSPNDIEFSLLTTALSYANITEYVGLESNVDIEPESLNLEHVKNLFLWMFVAQPNQKSILRESRNLKKLAAIVAEPEAVEELLAKGNLDEAFELSKGTAMALTQSLLYISRKLQKAWTWLPKVRVLEEEHEIQSREINETAEELYQAIARKLSNKSVKQSPAIKRKR